MNAGESVVETPKKIRAFIAIKTPPAWDSALRELQSTLKEKLRSKVFKWTKPEQIHITLRFLGSIRPEDTATIVERINDEVISGRTAFDLRCEGLGCFPNSRRPRVFWTGITGDTAPLQELHAAVTAATRTFGEPPEDRQFKAHLTLARIQQPERSALDELEHAIARGFRIESEWNVKELILMQSHLSPHGATYEPIASWPLN
jgi:2'-5' RNA ligase